MKPLKVLFFLHAFAGGGAEKQCAYLANALAKLGHIDVGLVHFHEGVNFPLIDASRVKLHKIPVRSNYDPVAAWKLRKLIVEEGPDVVFSWLHTADVFTLMARAMGARFKWLMAERNSWYPLDVRFLVRSWFCRYADAIVSNSEKGDFYWAHRHVPSERRHVIGNILPDHWFESSARCESSPLVCYAGRFEPQKNVLRVAKAFSVLSWRRTDVAMVMVGTGTQQALVTDEVANGREGKIDLHAYQQDVAELFRRVSVFVNLSWHEGLPNTVIENIALGNRVVLSRIPEHVSLVGEDYPFLVDAGADPDTLASAIEAALATPVTPTELVHFHRRLGAMRVLAVAESYALLLQRVAA